MWSSRQKTYNESGDRFCDDSPLNSCFDRADTRHTGRWHGRNNLTLNCTGGGGGARRRRGAPGGNVTRR